jgi:hypothetical protein
MEVVMSLIEAATEAARQLVVRPAEREAGALAATFALATALRDADVSFKISTEQLSAAAEAVAAADGYTLRMNGTSPQHYTSPAEVVRAVTQPR